MSFRTLIPSLALLIASGSLAAQEAVHQAKPDPSLKYHYKRFTRGDNEKIADEAWGRHQWWLERMGGELGPDFYQHYIKEAEKERARYPRLFPRPGVEMPVAITETAWTNIGPTTAAFASNGTTLNIVDSGRARVILPHPTNPDIVYFLNAGGGLWKTTNFTASTTTWTPTTDNIGSTAGGSAAFGRTPEVLYLGTGDAFDGGVGGFIVKSTDAAATWGSAVFLTGATKVLDIQVDTSGAKDIVLVGTNAGLFRSDDAGAIFTPIAAGTGGVFAGKLVWSIVRTSAGWLANAQTPNGAGALYLSTDQGQTWNPITNTGNVFTGAGRSTLAVALPGDQVVYCFAATSAASPAQLDLFKSTDGGQTWVALGITTKIPARANSHQADMNIMADQAFYNHMVLVDPTDVSRNTVIVGGQLATARSTNGGATWTLLTDWLPDGTNITLPYSHADHHCAAITNIGGTKRIFFGHDGGLTWSQDNGVTFDDKKNDGLATHLIYALAVNPKQTGSALIGLQDNGTRSRVLSPLETTYNQIRGGDGFGVGWAPGSGRSLCSYVYNSIGRSTTNPPIAQANWSTFTTGLPTPVGNTNGASANYYFVTPIITPMEQADPTGNVFFTYGRKGIYKSNATGWTTIGTPGTGGLSTGRVVRGVSHGLGVHPSNLNIIGAAGTGGYLMLTTDGGSSWTERFLGAEPTTAGLVPGWYGFNSNVAWATDQILFACSEATTPGAAHVAKSTDGGATWTRSDAGLPDVPVTKIAMDMGDGTSQTAYAATWLGVYRTTDGGANWTRFGTGLPQGRVSDIYVAPDSSFIRIATWGRGVWEMVNVPTTGTVTLTPTSAFLYPGQTATFTGTVNGGGTVNYTATGGTITSSGLYTAGTTAGAFSVVATNAADSTKSATVPVTVAVPVAVAFTTQPQSVTSGVGLNATFTVAATGTGPLSYQWKKNGSAITGATAAFYTTPALALADNGNTYLCEVTGVAGMVPSSAATLTVKALGAGVSVTNTTVGLIPDTGSTGSPLDVPFVVSGVTGNVADVTVGLYVTHTWVGDLTITLLSPDGTPTILATKIGGGASGLSNTLGKALGSSCGTPTLISDAGTKAIQTAVSTDLPLVGTWVPYQAMAAFRGKNPNGTWTLRLKDNGTGDQGTFRCGSLTVTPFAAATTPSFDVNGDGTVDGYDLLAFLKSYGSAADADLSKADFNTDGQINDTDLTAMLGAL